MARGRPPGAMTHRRQQVLQLFADDAAQGGHLSLAEVARRCGLYDYRHARRVVSDLKRLGAI